MARPQGRPPLFTDAQKLEFRIEREELVAFDAKRGSTPRAEAIRTLIRWWIAGTSGFPGEVVKK